MMTSAWHIEEAVPQSGAQPGSPALVSLRFLVDALRRRWRTWVGAGVVGLLLAAAWTIMVPASTVGTVTLLLAHEPGSDPAAAMSTDVSLLRTRTVAATVIDNLGLDMTPEAFQQSVVATPVTSQVMVLDVLAPDAASAKKRASTLASTFLAFRSAQLQARSDSLIKGLKGRVTGLQDQVDALTAEYDRQTALGPTGQSQAAAALTQRSQLNAEISTLQENIENTSLQSDSLLIASHVLDPASTIVPSGLKRTVLALSSGLIGGLALGIGVVLFSALTSDRLRRRDEVALALGVPVRVSVGELRGHRVLPFTKPRLRERELAVLVHALETALPDEEEPGRLIIASVDNIEDGQAVTAALGSGLAVAGTSTLLVDLSESGGLGEALADALDRAEAGSEVPPMVLRPDGVPHLASGPFGVPAGTTGLVSEDDPRRVAWNTARVVLTLTSIDPGNGVDELATWGDRVVILVTAGRCSAERLRTAAELVRMAGLELVFAVMVGSDRTDESLGLPDTAESGPSSTQRRALS